MTDRQAKIEMTMKVHNISGRYSKSSTKIGKKLFETFSSRQNGKQCDPS